MLPLKLKPVLRGQLQCPSLIYLVKSCKCNTTDWKSIYAFNSRWIKLNCLDMFIDIHIWLSRVWPLWQELTFGTKRNKKHIHMWGEMFYHYLKCFNGLPQGAHLCHSSSISTRMTSPFTRKQILFCADDLGIATLDRKLAPLETTLNSALTTLADFYTRDQLRSKPDRI